jgi:hypothetical protein
VWPVRRRPAVARRRDFTDKPGGQGALGAPQFVEEQQALGLFGADQAWQVPAGAGVRRVGHAGVAGLEACRLPGDAQVAAQGQVHPGTDGGAIDGGNGRFFQAVQAGHQGMGGFGPAVGFQRATGFGLGPLIEVGTGAEAATATGQYHHAYRWISVVGVEQGVKVFSVGMSSALR